MTFRSVLFWIHLAAGVICGLVIALMCFTGTALAFEKELTAWAERDARRFEPPAAGTARLPLDELVRRFGEAHPGVAPANIVFSSEPGTAVAFTTSRTVGYHVNPHTGEVRQPASFAVGGFMQTMLEWHRYLGFAGETSRPRGKLVTGICNVAFCVLGVTGLYLWMPRSWSWRAVSPVIWFRQNASSRARDFNWHNTIGFWCAPVLIALTLTAMPISFRWAATFLYTATGTELPASGPQSSGAAPPAATVPEPAAGAIMMSRESLLAAAQRELPHWQSITTRFAAPAAKQPVSFTVREHDTWPRTATTTLQYDPYTGTLLRRDGYAELSAARQARAWSRYLHTGEAIGKVGQVVAAIASLGGLVLAYTGLALAWRRFFKKKPVPEPARG